MLSVGTGIADWRTLPPSPEAGFEALLVVLMLELLIAAMELSFLVLGVLVLGLLEIAVVVLLVLVLVLLDCADSFVGGISGEGGTAFNCELELTSATAALSDVDSKFCPCSGRAVCTEG